MNFRGIWAASCSLVAGGWLVLAHWNASGGTPEGAIESEAGGVSDSPARRSLVGDADKLRELYDEWRRGQGGGERVELALAWSKGRSAEFTRARGLAEIDLAAREIAIQAAGFGPEESGLDAWLVEYRPGSGAEYGAREDELLVPLGTFALEAGAGRLVAELGDELYGAFELDLVALSRAGTRPSEGGLLYGTPGLFQRLYSAELRAAQGAAERAQRRAVGGLLLALAAPMPAPGGGSTDPAPSLEDLIAEGERLFCEEKFEGNGRTCCTCHPFDNNLTIEPAFISTLPDGDALFVAEFIPALDSTQNGGLMFENPVLMRQFGLIVENLDGFDDLAAKFTMRSVPHTLALSTSIRTPPGGVSPPKDRTGWSGDGAPGDGALRDFATGAVTQHFPLTLERRDGYDFRLPTPDELTAMEAFQLSTGRKEDPDLGSMAFVDLQVEIGKNVFNAQGKCSSCHFNAGANSRFFSPPIFNENFDTGVEEFTQNHPDGTGEPRPTDGGFGTTPNDDGSFGDGSFNTPPLVELADTLPAFHSNVTNLPGSGLEDSVEGAIRFYNSDEFNDSPGGAQVGGIRLEPLEIEQVGKFLRVLNALENERSASAFAKRARDILVAPSPTFPDFARVNQLLKLGVAECEDAVQVLEGASLHPDVQEAFKKAADLLTAATSGSIPVRIARIDRALEILADLRGKMVTE